MQAKYSHTSRITPRRRMNSASDIKSRLKVGSSNIKFHTLWLALFLMMTACLTGCHRAPTQPTTTTNPSPSAQATLTASFTFTPSPSLTDTPIPPSPTSTRRPTLTPFPTEITFEVVGQIGGYASSVAVQGKTAYLGVGPQVLVLDVSDPHSPIQIGQSGLLPDMVRDITVDNGLVYIAAGSGGLRIMDLSNPTSPRTVGAVPFEGFTDQVIVKDRVAFLDESQGEYEKRQETIRLIDCSDPANPYEISRLEGRIIDIQGDHAYIDREDGLKILDISNPRQVRTVADTGLQNVDAISGQYAYVIDVISDTLRIVDISDADKPREVGNLTIENDYLEHLNGVIVMDNTYLYLKSVFWGESAYRWSTLYLVNVANPAAPRLVLSYDGRGKDIDPDNMSGGIGDVVLMDGLLYMAKGDIYAGNGLFILNINAPAVPVVVGSFHVLSNAEKAVGIGNYAYVHNGYFPDYLNQVDLTNPKNILDRGTFLRVMGGDRMDVVGNYTYGDGYLRSGNGSSADRYGFILDITDPAKPSLVDPVVSGLVYFSFVNKVEHCACASQPNNMTGFYDLTDPTWPRQISRINITAKRVSLVTCAKNRVFYIEDLDYPSEFSILHIVDLSDAAQSREVSTFQLRKYIRDLAYQNGYLYIISDPSSILDEDPSLLVLNISDSTNPQQIASMSLNWYALSITIQDHFAYIANGDVTVIDISDPSHPRPVGLFKTPGNAQHIMIKDDILYVSDGTGGLLILRVRE